MNHFFKSAVPSSAVKLASIAAHSVKAYKQFLKLHGIKTHSEKSFLNLPITDKNNYIRKYPLRDLLPNYSTPAFAYSSSGSSGQSLFWFRNNQEEKRGGLLHEIIFKDVFGIKKRDSTLVIICFSMGVWVAGNFTAACCRHVTDSGYNLTTITPGIDKEDIFRVFKDLAPNYKNIIIAGYPTFVSQVLAEAQKQKINFINDWYILTAGDKFTEKWRDQALRLIKTQNPTRCVGIYGSADAGMIGFETPFTISLRRSGLNFLSSNEKLTREQLNQSGLYQYIPDLIYLERQGEELVLTTATSIPLIRYNIHDRGEIISSEKLKRQLKSAPREIRKLWKRWNLPVVVVGGRTDVAVTYYALNIYPEHIQTSLKSKKLLNIITGKYFIYTTNDKGFKKQTLHITLETAENYGDDPQKQLNLIQDTILKKLLRVNMEYRKLYSALGASAKPRVTLIPFGHHLNSNGNTGILYQLGKKPKIWH